MKQIVECTETRTLGLPVSEMLEAQSLKKSEKVLLKGRIIDDMNHPIPYASVMIKGTNMGTACDSIGGFELRVNGSKGDSLTLLCSAVGYDTKDILIEKPVDKANDLTVILEASSTLGEVVISSTGLVRGRVVVAGTVSAVTRCYITKSDTVKDNSFNKKLKVYPSPVIRFQQLQIQFTGETEKGVSVQILNIEGKKVFDRRFNSTKGENLFQISIDGRWAAGVYSIVITDADGRLITQEKIMIK